MNDMMGKMRDLLKPWMKGTSPLEIRRAILDDVESRVIAVGEGKRIFPNNLLRVHLLVADAEERVRFEAVVREGWNLKREISERLADRGCPLPAGFDVEVAFDEEAHPRFADRRFYVEYLNREAPAEDPVKPAAPAGGPPASRPVLELTVLKGTATQRVYEIEGTARLPRPARGGRRSGRPGPPPQRRRLPRGGGDQLHRLPRARPHRLGRRERRLLAARRAERLRHPHLPRRPHDRRQLPRPPGGPPPAGGRDPASAGPRQGRDAGKVSERRSERIKRGPRGLEGADEVEPRGRVSRLQDGE